MYIYICTLLAKYLSVFCLVFCIVINLFCALRLQLFDKKYSINVVVLSNSITILNIFFLFQYISKCILFLWCKAEFSVSQDPSEIILICGFDAQDNNVKKNCAA